jgi:hypothetical protein
MPRFLPATRSLKVCRRLRPELSLLEGRALQSKMSPMDLNPQPLPPGFVDRVYMDLNPQPLPPGHLA